MDMGANWGKGLIDGLKIVGILAVIVIGIIFALIIGAIVIGFLTIIAVNELGLDNATIEAIQNISAGYFAFITQLLAGIALVGSLVLIVVVLLVFAFVGVGVYQYAKKRKGGGGSSGPNY